MKRMAANAGAFYPASCQEIETMIAQFNATLDGALRDRGIVDNVSRAIIAPHAG
jgi:AmmeMemoRadiSam system protein B